MPKDKDRIPVPNAASGSTDPVIDPTVFTQSRFSTRTRFEFGKEDFVYRLDAEGNSHTYRMEYTELSSDRETLTERNTWWRNVGILWMLIGVVSGVINYAEHHIVRVPIWLWLGIICYAVYHFRLIRYQIIPAERCKVVIIDDAAGARIIDALTSARARQLRQRYDYITTDEHPDQQRRRFQWLGKQGAMDANEVSARLLQIDAMVGANQLREASMDEDDA